MRATEHQILQAGEVLEFVGAKSIIPEVTREAKVEAVASLLQILADTEDAPAINMGLTVNMTSYKELF
jgi:hypothetical protein